MWKLLTLLTWEKFLNWEIPPISRELEIQMGGNYKLCVSIQQTFIKAAINHIGIKGGGTSPCHQVDHRPMNKGKSWIRGRNVGLLPRERGCLVPEHGPGVSSGASLIVTQGYAQILSGPFLCAWAVEQVLSLFWCCFSRTRAFFQSCQFLKWAVGHCPHKPLPEHLCPSHALTPHLLLSQVKSQILMLGAASL